MMKWIRTSGLSITRSLSGRLYRVLSHCFFHHRDIFNHVEQVPPPSEAALEATQGQNCSFLSQLPYKCYLEEVASVGG